MSLPEPRRLRWQPLRCGFVDLYRYDEQEFRFEDGRLLLRGNNGTGKSRVLALTLPFLLDGEVGPHRLEPDGDKAKRIEWNLLLDKRERRLGYTWIEFGRRDDDGTTHFVTLGCGLLAVRGKGSPNHWFFRSEKRVGESLFLQEGGYALSRDRLRAAVAPDGEVVESVGEWRKTVDRALFRLGPRYVPLVDLLIRLRQPQLSRDLDERKLSDALSQALPPLAPGVVEPLAEAFRALEADRSELDGFIEAQDATAEFLGRYRSYAGVVARRRAAKLRSAQATYQHASTAALRASEALTAAKVALVDAEAQYQSAQGIEADARTRLETLQQAPAMDKARGLERAREAALTATTEANKAENIVVAARSREAFRQRDRVDAESARDRAAASVLQLTDALQRTAEPVGLEVTEDRSAWERNYGGRRRAAAQLEAAEKILATAVDASARARRLRDDRQSELDDARERESEASHAVKRVALALRSTVAEWAPVHLRVDTEAVLYELEGWSDNPVGRGPVETAATEAERLAIGMVEAEKATFRQERQGLAAERSVAVEELARLKAGGHEPLAAWPHRERVSGQPGAPFWQLCDFAPGLSAGAQRGLEAALQASGLLDAWVTPTGSVLPAGVADAAITLDSPVAQNSLATKLLPLQTDTLQTGAPQTVTVPRAIIAAVLDRIGLDEGAVWVAEDGRYALGPLRGAWHKPKAQHIGETARETERQRRMAELRSLVEKFDGELRALDASLVACEVKARAIRTESLSRPDESGVKDAAVGLSRAQAESARHQVRLVEAEQVLLSRRADESEKRGQRDALAADLGFVRWLGLPRELEAALRDTGQTAAEYFAALRGRDDAERALQKAQSAFAEAAQDHEHAHIAAEHAERARRDAAVARDVLESTHGAEVAEMLAAVESAKNERTAATNTLLAADKFRRAAERGEAGAIATDAGATERATTTQVERDTHVGDVTALVDAGLLAVLELSVPPVQGSTSRAVDLARRIEEQLASIIADDSAWSRVQDGLHRDLEDLRRALLPHRWDPVLRVVDELFVVEVALGDGPLRLPQLRAKLETEVVTRQETLTAREREVIENHLVGELATELHNLIHEGESLVREMSREVESRATSTGMKLRFDWRLREDAGPSVGAARTRLMRQGAAWSAQDRDLIAEFLKARLDAERQVDRGATWQQQIAKAFDYREWHSFVVERHQDGQWKALTKRTHGTGSGGEKAIALTIPQLAAAAAYYRNADKYAPRLILLDEAFVGVDTDMRAKCMGLFATFDLDFMMTSEREWACYATLPGVAICQLATQPGIDAIDVVRWVWNGSERRQE